MGLLFTMRNVESELAQFATPRQGRYKSASFSEVYGPALPKKSAESLGLQGQKQVGETSRVKTSSTRKRSAPPSSESAPKGALVAVEEGNHHFIDPFAKPGIAEGVVLKDAARANPSYLRRTTRGALAVVKKGQRKAGKAIAGAIDRATTPGVKAGYSNIKHGIGQIVDDARLSIKRRGIQAIEHVGTHAGKYAGAAVGLAAVGGGAAYLLNKNKQASMSRYGHQQIYFSRRRY